MDKLLRRVAIVLRWLCGLWLVAWALYTTLWDNTRLADVAGMIIAVATLLIPAALAFGFSCLLGLLAKTVSNVVWRRQRRSKIDLSTREGSRACAANDG